MSTIKTNQLAHTANGASIYTLPQTDGSAGQVLRTDGSGNLSWVNDSGKILQVVSGIKTDTFVGTSNTNLIELTGLSATITASNSSNKILIHVSLNYCSVSTTYKARIRKDSTDILLGDAASSRAQGTFGLGHTHDANQIDVATFVGVDTAGDTNPHTYKIMLLNDNNLAMHINRSDNDSNGIVSGRFPSTITLMEIAA